MLLPSPIPLWASMYPNSRRSGLSSPNHAKHHERHRHHPSLPLIQARHVHRVLLAPLLELLIA